MSHRTAFDRLCLIGWTLLSAACGGGGGGGGGTDGGTETDGTDTNETEGVTTGEPMAVELHGAVQKGPFILGSTITVSTLDASGNPTGQNFMTDTNNDRGKFAVTFDAIGSVALEGNGFYYNEVTGGLSTAPITLRAMYVVEQAGSQSATINLFTHLAFNRTKALLGQGIDFEQAVTQAEDELVAALDIGYGGFDPQLSGVELDLTGGNTDANAYLLAVSSVLGQAALTAAGGMVSQVDAKLQELVNKISLDLADDGAIDPMIAMDLAVAESEIDTDAIEGALAARFMEIGETAEVPDMDRILDQDEDGLLNIDDNCPRHANPGQQDGDGDGVGTACDPCPQDVDNINGLGCSCTIGGPDCNDGLSCPAGTCVPTQVTAVRVGAGFSCALLDSGAVRCWGTGYGGQLGYGNIDVVWKPADAGDVPIGGPVYQFDTGFSHTCALLEQGEIRCWGQNIDGTLGYGNTEDVGDDETPARVGDVNVTGTDILEAVSCSMYESCALMWGAGFDRVRCWGGGVGDDEDPAVAPFVNVGGQVAQVESGDTHSCVVLDTGALRCWGIGLEGALGYGNKTFVAPDAVATAGDVPVGGTVKQVALGFGHTCAVLDTGALRCWGLNESGKLGYGHLENIGDDETPASVGDVDVGGKVVQVSAGFAHTCAVLEGGKVRCWGEGDSGRLGYGNTEDIGDDETPAIAGDVDVGGFVIQVSAGGENTCALLDNGAVRCWGYGDGGANGYGNSATIGDNETPASAGDVPVI